MKQIALPIITRPPPSFASFVPGANALALAQLGAVQPGAELPGAVASVAPFYLWGPSGSGKTHLLRALAGRFRQARQGVAWFDADTPGPWAVPPVPAPVTSPATAFSTALIVLDACEAFDAGQQHAAFTLFVEAATLGITVAAAGRLPPVDLPLREDLRTRLGWGHVLALQPLSEADTRSALRDAAHAGGLVLSDEVASYLLTHFARDLKHLMAQLDHLDRFSLETGRAITLPMLKTMLADAAG